MKPGKGRVHIGTSGWNYDDWIGPFYSAGTKRVELLHEYSKVFDTVELNNSHYQLPKPKSASEWYKQSPENFIFACKAHRYITHRTRLQAFEGIDLMRQAFGPLGEKLGPILYQLPGNWKVDVGRLQKYLESLPHDLRFAFEFRDTSWLCDAVYELLEQHQVALCFYDYGGFESPQIVTAEFIYLRLHGPNETPYSGSYSENKIAGYAKNIRSWQNQGKDVFCYFDNDQHACAPLNARSLLDQLSILD